MSKDNFFFLRHELNKCCGIYPNRYRYDFKIDESCKIRGFYGDGNPFDIFKLTRQNESCNQMGGTVVVSSPDDPNKYVNLWNQTFSQILDFLIKLEKNDFPFSL